MNEIEKNLLKEVAELDALPVVAYNLKNPQTDMLPLKKYQFRT